MKNIKNLLALATMAILAVACGSTAATPGTASDTGAAADDTTDTGPAADTGVAAGDTAAGDVAMAGDATAAACAAPNATGLGDFKGCTGAADQTFLGGLKDEAKVTKFKDDVRTCTLMKGCGAKADYAAKVQCITDCMVDIYKADGLTESCARCYGFTGQCGVEKCISKCAVDQGECTPCLAQFCDCGANYCKAAKCEPKSGNCASK